MVRIAQGFTLVEVLTVLTVLSVTGMLALANLPQWMNVYRAEASMHELRTAINIARHTAITKRVNVVLCARAEHGCGSRDGWHHGAIIFEDRDHDRNPSAADVVVAHIPGIDHGNISWRAFRSRRYLLFTSRGLTDWQNGHLLYCPNNNDPRLARQIVLNYAGRTYPSRDRNNDGVHEDTRGRPLQCA